MGQRRRVPSSGKPQKHWDPSRHFWAFPWSHPALGLDTLVWTPPISATVAGAEDTVHWGPLMVKPKLWQNMAKK